MHVLENTEPISLGKAGVLLPGKWVMQDQNAFELSLMAARGTATVRKYGIDPAKRPVGDMIIMRSGAIGDLLLMSPAIREFRKAHPDLRLHLSRFAHHAGLFDETGLFDGYVDYPMPLAEEWFNEHIVSLEDVLELNPQLHATDAFAAALGVTVNDYRPSYVVRDFEQVDAEKWLRHRSDRPKVAVQLMASSVIRNYPMERWKAVIDALIANGWHVLIFGSPEMTRHMNHAKFMTPIVGQFRECAAIFAECDAFVGVDSVWSHMCHALDVPGVVLYGAFDPATRTGKNPNVTALVGKGPCAPCSYHKHVGNDFPVTEACSKKGVCSVLASINPATIISAVNRLKP